MAAAAAQQRRSESALRAYRNAIDDLLGWAELSGRGAELFEERAIVDHLDDYRQRVAPAAATYHRRFLILRRFMRWLSHREGVPDPFLDLEAPRKPRQESEWLTPAEFRRMLAAAGRPLRRHTGIVERDRLVLLALVTTGLRRSELINLDWRDLSLDGPQPSLLVRHGKGDKPRRQPLAPQLAEELRQLQLEVHPAGADPVFCGLAGGRLQPKVLAAIIKRAAERAGLEKHVTAHTLRHTAATWLRQETGDTRLVAEYLGHADLSTVSRYAHVAERELHEATAALGRLASNDVAQIDRRRAA
ncbi:MAG: tyrosine-type recombinase/integrase [Gaiellaceae bacterium]